MSIHFGEDKTKKLLFGTKEKPKKDGKLNMIYNRIDVKQHSSVTYLGCILGNARLGGLLLFKTIYKKDQI